MTGGKPRVGSWDAGRGPTNKVELHKACSSHDSTVSQATRQAGCRCAGKEGGEARWNIRALGSPIRLWPVIEPADFVQIPTYREWTAAS